MTDVHLLEPVEVLFVQADAHWRDEFSVLSLVLALALQLVINSVLHRVCLRLGVVVVEYRHLVLHELGKWLATSGCRTLLLHHLRLGIAIKVIQLEQVLLRVGSPETTLLW